LLAISKHEFNPGQLFKIDLQLKDQPKDSHLKLSEGGILIKAERDASPKEYPSFRSLHDPLHIYFNVLMHQLIVASNPTSLIDFAHGSSKYISGLYKIYIKYERPQVLEYHIKFHNRQIVEMLEGLYTGWGHVDANLMSIYLFGHPKSQPPRHTGQQLASALKDTLKQFCYGISYGKCPSPCKAGRIHKCHKCSLPDHGASSCPKSE